MIIFLTIKKIEMNNKIFVIMKAVYTIIFHLSIAFLNFFIFRLTYVTIHSQNKKALEQEGII